LATPQLEKKARNARRKWRPTKRLMLVLGVAWVLNAGLLLLTAQQPPSDKVNLQSIVVETAEKAQQVLERVKKGEDFAALAKEFSIEPSASNGGYLGEVDPALLRPELREALVSLRPGETSGAIKVATGFVVLKLLEKKQEPSAGGSTPAQNIPGQGMGPNRDLHIGARGAIQYPADVAGQVLADMLFQKYPKPANWEQDLQEVCRVRRQSLADGISSLEKLLANSAEMARKTAFDAIQTQYALAQLAAYQGNMDRAIEHWEAAYKRAAVDLPAGTPQLTEVLGVAYLHKSQLANDVYPSPGEQCLFPPHGNACYQQTLDSERAIEYFTKYLELKPERPDAVQVRW